jgi:hypothetical protein
MPQPCNYFRENKNYSTELCISRTSVTILHCMTLLQMARMSIPPHNFFFGHAGLPIGGRLKITVLG